MELQELGFKGKRLEKLNSDGIASVPELLYKKPRKYMFMDKLSTLAVTKEILDAAQKKIPVVVSGHIAEVILDRLPSTKVSVVKMDVINNETSTKLHVEFFGAKHKFAEYREMKGSFVYIGGVISHRIYKGYDILSMKDPFLFTQSRKDLKIYPVYRKYSGISQETYENAIKVSYESIKEDYMPKCIMQKYRLLGYKDTVRSTHFPKNASEITEAQKRMVFDNMLYFASRVENENRKAKETEIKPVKADKMGQFIKSLPYDLTEDQQNAITTLREKMCKEQTTALIQGDVSCGKTIVAMCLMMLMAENDYQSILMAPTVILARQHYEELSRYASTFGFSVALLSSDLSTAEKKKVLSEIASGKHQMIVGTQSCFSKDASYRSLGLVITDEEHKFGVMQRECIRNKSEKGIHMISMSATPIPRSLACSIYGKNVNVITIKQMPGGRKKVKTAICSSDEVIFKFLKDQIEMGHQAYIVCPLIEQAEEESKMEGVSSVEDVARKYKKAFPDKQIGVITGKMGAEEAKQIKQAFSENRFQILIATTVIEVGINVPNASVIVIESAERFGLATLHQLRGRVGRGTIQSYCILKKSNSDVSSDNLQILQRETNGFEIAKADFKNRGPGNIFGNRQSGNNGFVELIIEYPKLYEKVTQIAAALSETERKTYIEKFEECYPSCS